MASIAACASVALAPPALTTCRRSARACARSPDAWVGAGAVELVETIAGAGLAGAAGVLAGGAVAGADGAGAGVAAAVPVSTVAGAMADPAGAVAGGEGAAAAGPGCDAPPQGPQARLCTSRPSRRPGSPPRSGRRRSSMPPRSAHRARTRCRPRCYPTRPRRPQAPRRPRPRCRGQSGRCCRTRRFLAGRTAFRLPAPWPAPTEGSGWSRFRRYPSGWCRY